MRSLNKALCSVAIVSSMLLSSAALAAKTYQVTGIVVKLTDKIITIEKGTGSDKEKWEIDRDSNTKVTGTLKEGAKVTIEYTMSAKSVDVK